MSQEQIPPAAQSAEREPAPPRQPVRAGMIALVVLVVLGLTAFVSWIREDARREGEGLASSAPRVSFTDLSDRTDAELADWVAVYRRERDDLAAKLAAEEARHPRFLISGDVKDRDETSLAVFGVAVPNDLARQNDLGAVMRKASVVVEGYHQRGLMGGQFYNGEHNFLRKAEGKNAFGAAVPVWVYGAAPAVQKARDRLAKADKKLAGAEAEQARRSQAKAVPTVPTSTAPAGAR